MADGIGQNRPEPRAINVARTQNVEDHIQRLVDLRVVVDRVISSMIHFGLSLKFSVEEFEAARLNAAVTESDLYSTKELLTEGEVSRKIGVPVALLRKDRSGKFPKPFQGTGRSVRYRRADVQHWLLRASGAYSGDERE